MKKTRFLWIRDLPTKCRDSDIRNTLQRHGALQKIRVFKDGQNKHAVVSFMDVKTATTVLNAEPKFDNKLLKMEYCDSVDFTGVINRKLSHRRSSEPVFDFNKINHLSNNNNNTHNSNDNNNNIKLEKERQQQQYFKNVVVNNNNNNNNNNTTTQKASIVDSNDPIGRGPLIFKRTTSTNNVNNITSYSSNNTNTIGFTTTTTTTGTTTTTNNPFTTNTSNNISNHNQSLGQVLRPTQTNPRNSAIINPTNAGLMRGLKLTDLPPVSKLPDAQLRQNLFTEFRHCGRIQSVLLPPFPSTTTPPPPLSTTNKTGSSNCTSDSSITTNGSGSTTGVNNNTRTAIITFRRPEEAECAYEALQGGTKLLFSTPISVELHPGVTTNDELSASKRNLAFNSKLTTANNLSSIVDSNTNNNGGNKSTNISSHYSQLDHHSTSHHHHHHHHHHHPHHIQPVVGNSKLPTRTLNVDGLTNGPGGPVTSEQLTMAFRKFGDIMNVQLNSGSHSALIQFTEMRGPMRAMNAHSRDPLRLGGRPLSLRYVPSTPSSYVWISDLPQTLINLSEQELFQAFAYIVPIQEIAVIYRNESPLTKRSQSTNFVTNTTTNSSTPHHAVLIKLSSSELATRLLNELRTGIQVDRLSNGLLKTDPRISPSSSPPFITSATSLLSLLSSSATSQTTITGSRRLIAIDFASPKQLNNVSSLQFSMAKLTSPSSNRVKIITFPNSWKSQHQQEDTAVTTVSTPASSLNCSLASIPSRTNSTNDSRRFSQSHQNNSANLCLKSVVAESRNSSLCTTSSITKTNRKQLSDLKTTHSSDKHNLTNPITSNNNNNNNNNNSNCVKQEKSKLTKSIKTNISNSNNPDKNRHHFAKTKHNHHLNSMHIIKTRDTSPGSLSTSSISDVSSVCSSVSSSISSSSTSSTTGSSSSFSSVSSSSSLTSTGSSSTSSGSSTSNSSSLTDDDNVSSNVNDSATKRKKITSKIKSIIDPSKPPSSSTITRSNRLKTSKSELNGKISTDKLMAHNKPVMSATTVADTHQTKPNATSFICNKSITNTNADTTSIKNSNAASTDSVNCISMISQQPLRIVTTSSNILSLTSCNSTNDVLSSPVHSSGRSTNDSSGNSRTSNTTTTTMTTTAAAAAAAGMNQNHFRYVHQQQNEFKISPSSRAYSVSASSGVSSGGPSFGSTNSSGGGSTDSSPLNNNNNNNTNTNNLVPVPGHNNSLAAYSSPVCSLLNKQTNHSSIVQLNNTSSFSYCSSSASPPPSQLIGSVGSCATIMKTVSQKSLSSEPIGLLNNALILNSKTDTTNGNGNLKIHLSTTTTRGSSSSSGSANNKPVNMSPNLPVTNSTTTTTPLTVSIKFNNNNNRKSRHSSLSAIVNDNVYMSGSTSSIAAHTTPETNTLTSITTTHSSSSSSSSNSSSSSSSSSGSSSSSNSSNGCNTGVFNLTNYDKQTSNGNSSSLPQTPISAPPFGTKLSTNLFGDCHKRRALGFDNSISTPPAGSDDWWSHESPVYESMYDKIKRRTNKEAEERRQRQLEILTNKQKKREHQKKKAASNTKLLGADLLIDEQDEIDGSLNKIHHKMISSTGDRLLFSNSTKKDLPNHPESNHLLYPNRINLTRVVSATVGSGNGDMKTDKISNSLNQLSNRRSSMNHEYSSNRTKRHHSTLSSCTSCSSLSGEAGEIENDGDNSNSPPGTLTRLSLGMRFPVSATYHECIRPSQKSSDILSVGQSAKSMINASRWSQISDAEDDELNSQLSSSCSSSYAAGANSSNGDYQSAYHKSSANEKARINYNLDSVKRFVSNGDSSDLTHFNQTKRFSKSSVGRGKRYKQKHTVTTTTNNNNNDDHTPITTTNNTVTVSSVNSSGSHLTATKRTHNSASTASDIFPNKRKCPNTKSTVVNSSFNSVWSNHSHSTGHKSRAMTHSSHPYLSDDDDDDDAATVPDSDNEDDMKMCGSFVSGSDSISHTGSSDPLSSHLFMPTTDNHRHQVSVNHSETDDIESCFPDDESHHPISPATTTTSSVRRRCKRVVSRSRAASSVGMTHGNTTKTVNTSSELNLKTKLSSNSSVSHSSIMTPFMMTTGVGDGNDHNNNSSSAGGVGGKIINNFGLKNEDDLLLFDSLMDSDRLSTNSKSTTSTEPMELSFTLDNPHDDDDDDDAQAIDHENHGTDKDKVRNNNRISRVSTAGNRSPYMKFSDEEEDWNSGDMASSSPRLVNSECEYLLINPPCPGLTSDKSLQPVPIELKRKQIVVAPDDNNNTESKAAMTGHNKDKLEDAGHAGDSVSKHECKPIVAEIAFACHRLPFSLIPDDHCKVVRAATLTTTTATDLTDLSSIKSDPDEKNLFGQTVATTTTNGPVTTVTGTITTTASSIVSIGSVQTTTSTGNTVSSCNSTANISDFKLSLSNQPLIKHSTIMDNTISAKTNIVSAMTNTLSYPMIPVSTASAHCTDVMDSANSFGDHNLVSNVLITSTATINPIIISSISTKNYEGLGNNDVGIHDHIVAMSTPVINSTPACNSKLTDSLNKPIITTTTTTTATPASFPTNTIISAASISIVNPPSTTSQKQNMQSIFSGIHRSSIITNSINANLVTTASVSSLTQTATSNSNDNSCTAVNVTSASLSSRISEKQDSSSHPVSNPKTAISTTPSSGPFLPTSQLTEAHEITRYVQSVIERVKAERVEENQQAAAAAAALSHHHPQSHHNHFPAYSSTIGINNNNNSGSNMAGIGTGNSANGTSILNMNRSNAEYHTNASHTHSGKKSNSTGITNSKRSLLVTATTASSANHGFHSTKPQSIITSSTNANGFNSFISPTTHTATNSTTTIPIPVTSTSIMITTTNTASVNCISGSSTGGIVETPTQVVLIPDAHLPSIPGVNACTPLISSQYPPNKLMSSPLMANSDSNVFVSNTGKRLDHVSDATVSLNVTNMNTARKQKRPEIVTNASSIIKSVSMTSPANPSSSSSSTFNIVTAPSFVLMSTVQSGTQITTSTNVKRASDILPVEDSVQLITSGSTANPCPKPTKIVSATPIDPYEPNFDDESPKGFDPSQLHQHHLRPVTPTNMSPSNVNRSAMSPNNNHTLLSVSSSNSCVTTNNTSSSPVTCAIITTAPSVTTSNNHTIHSAPIRSIDSVDEVIRDVCAGQFDVQSYLNGWLSHGQQSQQKLNTPTVVVTCTSTKCSNPIVSTKSPVINATPVQTQPVSDLKEQNGIPSTAALPFSLSNEPVVAAVTIPVSLSSATANNNSSSSASVSVKNGGSNNNVVNLGTGNALLNTLLAALQLIPGSQVTVTGPTTASGVVGNLTGTNPGTISATTITLPVNAARQAAANIKAAVLSATGGALNNVNNLQPQVNLLPSSVSSSSMDTPFSTIISTNPSSSITTTTNQIIQHSAGHSINRKSGELLSPVSTSTVCSAALTSPRSNINSSHSNALVNQPHQPPILLGNSTPQSSTTPKMTQNPLLNLTTTFASSASAINVNNNCANTTTQFTVNNPSTLQPIIITSLVTSANSMTSTTATDSNQPAVLIPTNILDTIMEQQTKFINNSANINQTSMGSQSITQLASIFNQPHIVGMIKPQSSNNISATSADLLPLNSIKFINSDKMNNSCSPLISTIAGSTNLASLSTTSVTYGGIATTTPTCTLPVTTTNSVSSSSSISQQQHLLSRNSSTSALHVNQVALQSLVDRLRSTMEPSVAMSLLQAAINTNPNSSDLRRNLSNQNLNDPQLYPYLKQIAQQLMDNSRVASGMMNNTTVSTCSSSSSGSFSNATINSINSAPNIINNIGISPKANGLIRPNVNGSNLSKPECGNTISVESISTPLLGTTKVVCGGGLGAISNPSTTNNAMLNCASNACSIAQHNFTTPISVSTIQSDSADNTTSSALISPPVGAQRGISVSVDSSPITTTTITTTNTNTNNRNNNNNNNSLNMDASSWHNFESSYPLVWQGRLSLKNIETRVALHYIQGNHNLLNSCMTLLASGGGGQPQHSLVANGGPLRIVQRMRLEPTQLEGVQRKINQEGASCVCLSLPAGSTPIELVQQTQILNDNFIRYMQEKMAAGIINVGHPDYQQGLYVVHIFPPCEFSYAQLNCAAPDLHRTLLQRSQSHLLVVITTV